ncbi:MAG TPA: DinB family protein [Candidatus Limnocylindria bacterium]
MTEDRGVARYFIGWPLANERLVEAIAPLTAEQLGLEIRAGWPIWASVAHVAGARVYWLCGVFGEPGVETTPFHDGVGGVGDGWEDDLSHPRSAAELVAALESTWRIVERALATWTPDTLDREARRVRGDQVQLHSRGSALWRLVTHDAFHAGEISIVLGAYGLGGDLPNGPIDLWSGLGRVAAPTTDAR